MSPSASPRPSTLRPAAGLALLLALAALPAAGLQHPNHAQGFQPEHLYQLGDLDSINEFNGNLTVQIPLASYPVNGGFSVPLVLTYTGNVWDYELDENLATGGYYLMAVPRASDNSGLGWHLSFGTVEPTTNTNPGGYRSPDGAEHPLAVSLHLGGSTATGFKYTKDSTYLRYNTSVAPHVLEFPDGTRRDLVKDSKTGNERPTRIEDRFGNFLNIEYLASATYPGLENWRLTDSLHRVQMIYFKPAPALAKVYKEGVVDRVVVTAFGGQTLTYTFHYSGTEVTRGMTDPALSCAYASTTVVVPLLTSITRSDPRTPQSQVPAYDFTYDPGPYHGACDLAQTDSRSAHLLSMTLPTHGTLRWSWNYYLFPKRSETLGGVLKQGPSGGFGLRPFSRSVGVVQRQTVQADGTVEGTWTYQEGFTSDSSGIGRASTTTVTDPLGNQTTHYFSVYACQPGISGCSTQDPDPGGWSYHDYGLPFTRNAKDASGTRFLSSEIRQGASAVKRRIYVRYESSGQDFNPRVASERTVYVDDGGTFADTNSSSFDGLGHYRQVATNGSFAAGNVRTTFTNYNPGSCATCTPATGAAWLLGTYTYQTVTEGGVTAKTEACFDDTTGALKSTRTLRSGTTRSSTDLVTVYVRDGVGNVTSEKFFGGDTQGLGTGGLCGLALPAARYQIDHSYQAGVLASSQYSGQPFKSLDRVIDLGSGLVKTSRDVSGLATTYQYDVLGRPTLVLPAQEGRTQFLYSAPTDPPKVWIYRKPHGGGSPLSTRELDFDGLGRVSLERRTMADGTISSRATNYNAAGWVRSKTGWATNSATIYRNFDPFGRPTLIQPPDGSAHDVTLTYHGVRQVDRTVKVGTAWNGTGVTESAATTTEIYDRQGRLYQVFEPANPNGSDSTTTYAYDVGSRLKQASQTAKNAAGTSFTQTRLFNYDSRGFLLSERHPETGASGNGYVTYGSYDARGHAGTMTDGPNTLRFTYDGAERLTKVEESQGFGLYRPLKSFTFGTANGAGDYRLGKLQVARGYNYPVIGATSYTVEIDETYAYGGKEGRVSNRATVNVINGSAAESFTQSWVWNDLGDPASVTYPRCTQAGCSAGTVRTVSPTYTNGFLTAVPGYSSSITYHPNGQVDQVVRTNGVTDTYFEDPNGLPRPQKIEARRGTTLLYQTGLYTFDGAGDVTKMGSSYYLYDKVNRVLSGVQYVGQGGGTAAGGYAFSHTYDGFGNLQAMTTKTGRSTPTSSTTNRLTGAVSYDAAGDLTSWNGNAYTYDALDQMWKMNNGSKDWLYLYTADGERIWSYDLQANVSHWTIRDLDGKVLRDYKNGAGGWSVDRDYVYRGDQLLAAVTPTGVQHFHLDHLGSVRFITNASGQGLAYHAYFPFGEEATNPTKDTERMKFAGHERDLGNTSSAADDLDYMHARFCNPQTGRFLSTDSFDVLSLQFGDEEDMKRFREYLGTPQSWNRYAYVRDSPLRYVDRNGQDPLAAVATTTWFIGEGGTGAGAGGAGIAAGAGAGAAIVGAGAVGYGIGTLIRQIPGVDKGIQTAIGGVVDYIFTAQNNRHTEKVIGGLIAGAQQNLNNIASAGGPERDPDFNHHKKEIKAILERAAKLAKRLPEKTASKLLDKIHDIADKVGLRLVE